MEENEEKEKITLNIKRTAASKRKCNYPSCKNKQNLAVIPKELRFKIAIEEKVYIPVNVRACIDHIGAEAWKDVNLVIQPQAQYTQNYIEDMFELLSHLPTKDVGSKESHASDAEMKLYTGHDKNEFLGILSEVPEIGKELKSSDKASDALYIYLMRLRTGRSYDDIGLHFGVSSETVRRRCDLVRGILKEVLVPHYLNYEMSREELLKHKSNTSRILFDDDNDVESQQSVHCILDGTYIYLEKSTNHRFQKETYNSHKMRNYLKIMMGVLTDGHLLFALGPFKATENDASITEKIFTTSGSAPAIKSLRPGDIMIVDRGFRDCETSLINLGFVVKMPTCRENCKLTTKQANETRLVTRVRYNVERLNGVMKTFWKIFLNTVDIHYIPKIMVDFEIGAALINKRSVLVKESEKTDKMARLMKTNVIKQNVLSTIVDSTSFERLIRSKSYKELDESEYNIQLEMSDLEMVSLGPYQISQARCYLSNHLMNGNLTIFRFFTENVQDICESIINPDTDPLLLMTNLKSRFTSQTVHRVFILLDNNQREHNCVLAYCCSCKAGNRTVGCCAHVMSLLYYVTYGKVHGVRDVSGHLKNTFEANNWEYAIEESDEE